MQFSSAGVFRVAAQAVDRRLDLSNRSTTVVRIGGATGEPPLAAAVLDKLSGPVPLTVNINMSGSTDDGTISNYYIGCGGYFAAPSSSPMGSCQFTTPGIYWLVLQVMDNSGLMDVASAYVVATPSTGGGGSPPPPPDDTTPPSVTMRDPSQGATVSGTIDVSADASDASGITKVDFYRDSGVWLGTATTPASGITYKISWNADSVSSGSHTLYAVATDGATLSATSPVRNITVPAPPPPPPPPNGPTVSITSPANGAKVARKANVTIGASVNPGDNPVSRVEIHVNSGLVCSDTTAAYSCTWKVPAAPNKTYSIWAIAYDTSGASKVSPTITVTAP
jgi:hypothetical protein